MDKTQVEWAKQHDWYASHAQYAGEGEEALYQVWAKENGEALHPWPFRSFSELKRWVGY